MGEPTKNHQRLLAEIEAEARNTKSWTRREAFSGAVMEAMARVPRHEFVRAGDEDAAYVNRPLGIGHGQTISQPYIVAVMTDFLDLRPGDRVLEIGTGSGYQAAVLASVAGRVYTVEVIESLASTADARLRRLGYDTIEVRTGDGNEGWPEQAPFDAVMVTAAPRVIPDALVEQLKIGGRMVIPIGRVHCTQTLYLGVKGDDGKLRANRTLPVAFVPLV